MPTPGGYVPFDSSEGSRIRINYLEKTASVLQQGGASVILFQHVIGQSKAIVGIVMSQPRSGVLVDRHRNK